MKNKTHSLLESIQANLNDNTQKVIGTVVGVTDLREED